MKDDLFPEAELRALLRAEPESCEDIAFEQRVLDRIRREERRAVLIPAAVVTIALAALIVGGLPVLLGAPARWASLPGAVGQVLNALRPIGIALTMMAKCAPALAGAAGLQLRLLTFGTGAVLLVVMIARAFLGRISFRSTVSLLRKP